MGRFSVPARAALVACVLALAAAPAPAQRLGGGSAETPALDLAGRSYVEQVMVEIEGEVTTIAEAERGAGEERRAALRALINYRIITLELLGQGLAGGEGGNVAILAGLRMTYGREAVDAGVLRADDGAAPRVLTEAERRTLERFNDLAVERAGRIRTHDVDALDEHLPGILAPLWSFFTDADPTTAASYWPRRAGSAAESEPAPDAERLASLRRRAVAADLAPEALEGLVEMIDFVERGGRFREFRSAAAGVERDVVAVLDLVSALAVPRGFDEAIPGCRGRLVEIVVDLGSPAARADGRRALQRLVALNELMDEIVALRELGSEVTPLVEAVAFLCAEAGTNDRRVETCRRVVRRMTAYRRLEMDDAPAALRGVQRRLVRAYEDAERALLDELSGVVAAERPAADPALASLIADHRRRLEDLERTGRMRAWIDSVARIVPAQQRAFEGQIKRWSTSLVDPQRREAALEKLEEFERQHDRFAPVPFERALRSGESAVVTATGGENERLVALIDEERLRWARAWCRGEQGGAAGRRLALIAELTETIGESADLIALGDEIVQMNRWGAWTTPETLLNRLAADLPGRLKLATAAVVSGRDDGVGEQLALLEADAALARLAGACTLALLDRLEPLDAGPPATLGPLLAPPSGDAWMEPARGRLATLCRLAVELEFAAMHDRTADVELLRRRVDALATALMEETVAP
jgi:hypothetical protein